MNFSKLCELFVSNCFLNRMVFTEADICQFSKSCNVKIDYKFLNHYSKNLKYPNYVTQKSLLGPCIFHPKDVYLKDVKYNVGKIINDLQLSKQNISADAKMQKIVDYIYFI